MTVKRNVLWIISFWIFSGVSARHSGRVGGSFHNDYHYQKKAIECVFGQFPLCYKDFASLGAHFAHKFDETPHQIDETCRSLEVKDCLTRKCGPYVKQEIVDEINEKIKNVCFDKQEYSSFLNASRCYNRYIDMRENCTNQHKEEKPFRANSYCCSNKMTLKCMQEDLQYVCANHTNFMNGLFSTYRRVHSSLCEPFLQYCRGARLVSASSVILTTVFSIAFYKLSS